MKLSLVIVLHLEQQCLQFWSTVWPSSILWWLHMLRTDVPRWQMMLEWIWNDFKSNHKISNQIQIKSHVFQIKSLFFKSNHMCDSVMI